MAKNRGIKTEDRYWDAREREMKNLIQQEKFLRRYDKNVKEIYRRMMYDAQKEIEAFYGRYASKEGITISEAKKRVSRMDVEAFSKMAKRMVEAKDFSPQANAALRLYNLTMKVNRLELLKARIGLRLVDGFDEIDKLTETLLVNAGVNEFRRQAGILGESVINPEQKAEAIAKSSFQNANFSDRIWMYQDQLRNEIANNLRSGLIQGKNSKEMARKLRRRFGVSMHNASCLARTEMARVQTEAQMQSFERNGYTHYVFIARESACDHCAPLDGKIFAVKDSRPGVNAPPIHPHCFCSTAAATEEQTKNAERVSENNGYDSRKEGEEETYHKLSFDNIEEVEDWDANYHELNSEIDFRASAFPCISDYSEGDYLFINGVERYEPGSPEYVKLDRVINGELSSYKKKSDALSSELSRFKLNENIQVARNVKNVDFITGAGSSVEEMQACIGSTYVEKGFFSTTINVDGALPVGGNSATKTKLYVNVPKNTRGAFIRKISAHPHELEFLIDKGTKFKILDAGEHIVQRKNHKSEIVDTVERFMILEVLNGK